MSIEAGHQLLHYRIVDKLGESAMGVVWRAVFSPDDRFIAYVSNESGKANLYVRSLDGTARRQISEDAGWGPRWVDSGRICFHAWQGGGWQDDGTSIIPTQSSSRTGSRI